MFIDILSIAADKPQDKHRNMTKFLNSRFEKSVWTKLISLPFTAKLWKLEIVQLKVFGSDIHTLTLTLVYTTVQRVDDLRAI